MGYITNRRDDELTLRVLHLRRWYSAVAVAQHLNMKPERVRCICLRVLGDDLKYSEEPAASVTEAYPWSIKTQLAIRKHYR